MKTATEKRIAFRNNLKSGKIMIAPGVGDALGAKIAEMAGIPCLAMGGYSVSASRLGQPDVGLLSCTEMAEQLTGICNAVDIPVVADGDTGYGNALNIIVRKECLNRPVLPAFSSRTRHGRNAAATWTASRSFPLKNMLRRSGLLWMPVSIRKP